MCQHRSRFKGNDATGFLAAGVEFTSQQQQKYFTPIANDTKIGAILQGPLQVVVGKGLSSRKLNSLGEIDGVACIANSEERVMRLHQRQQLEGMVATLKSLKAADKKKQE